MDELLQAHAKQLKEIAGRLEEVQMILLADFRGIDVWKKGYTKLVNLKMDVGDMIRVAEAEHAAF